MFFRKKKNQVSKPSELSLLQALKAKPMQAVEGKFKPSTNGGGTLEVKIEQRRWAGFLFKMPQGATKKFELDAIGTMVWNACDGKKTVQRIIRQVAELCKISDAEAKAATLAFLNTLGKKGLVRFEVPMKKDEKKN